MDMTISIIGDKEIEVSTLGVFIEDRSKIREISIDEYKAIFPGREVKQLTYKTKKVFEYTFSNRLSHLSERAGLNHCIWNPLIFKDKGQKSIKAQNLIGPLLNGLAWLNECKDIALDYMEEPADVNYEEFKNAISSFYLACEQNPLSKITYKME